MKDVDVPAEGGSAVLVRPEGARVLGRLAARSKSLASAKVTGQPCCWRVSGLGIERTDLQR